MFNLRDPEDDRERRHEAQRRADREQDHAPAEQFPPRSNGNPPPRITTAMQVLAWTVLHGTWHDARDASRALAELVLEAS